MWRVLAFSTNPLPSRPFPVQLPFLDFRTTQVAQTSEYWPGATSATPYPSQKALPTPPGAEDGAFKPPGFHREGSNNGNLTAIQQNGMTASNMDTSGPASSLTARRSAASNLPNFELPPPQLSGHHKYPAYPLNTNNTQAAPANVNIGNLLTPPSQIPGDSLSPISSGMNSNSPPAAQGLPPFTPTAFGWPPPATGMTPNFSTGSGTTPQPWGQGLNPLFPPRGVFSPSLGSLARQNTNSPSASDGLPPPPYDLNAVLPFPSAMPSMTAPVTLPAIAAQQQQQQQQQQQHQQAQQQAMAQFMGSLPTPVSAGPVGAQPSPTDSYPSQRPPSTPTHYHGSQPSSTPQSGQFPVFQGPSPVQASPIGNTPSAPKLSPTNNHLSHTQPGVSPHGHNFPRPSFPSYSGLPGPILTNVHSPNGQMSVVGPLPHNMNGNMQYGFNSGHTAHMQQLYGPPQTPLNERPFKCDQCPQSFNRNHDLKRHKRIHLAVKPFPCGHCDKSFSRKDALKVSPSMTHITRLS